MPYGIGRKQSLLLLGLYLCNLRCVYALRHRAQAELAFVGALFVALPHRQRLCLWIPRETEFLDFLQLGQGRDTVHFVDAFIRLHFLNKQVHFRNIRKGYRRF